MKPKNKARMGSGTGRDQRRTSCPLIILLEVWTNIPAVRLSSMLVGLHAYVRMCLDGLMDKDMTHIGKFLCVGSYI